MINGKKVILPVWHGVTKKEVLHCSPFLADKVAADTGDGLDIVVQKLIIAIKGANYLESILINNEKVEKRRDDANSLSAYLLCLLKDRNIPLFNEVRDKNRKMSVDFHDCDLSNVNFDGADMY
jgi:hypothetical protein